jgi:FKBP-type peptidyl-prolyl cis-trans isomerase FkpA
LFVHSDARLRRCGLRLDNAINSISYYFYSIKSSKDADNMPIFFNFLQSNRHWRMTSLLAVVALASACARTPTTPTTPTKSAATSQATTLPSGVVVQHTQLGTGAQPTAANQVKVHYRGVLKGGPNDGKEFDSSFKRGQPATFPLTRVIPCWTQGVAEMKVGGKATLTCPPATAYGERNVGGGLIPPNSTLVFDVELLEVIQ